MKKVINILCLLVISSALFACGAGTEDKAVYMSITADEAKEIMDSASDYIILDVRTDEEFIEGHIPGAMLIPDYEVMANANTMLPDKDQLILVYCRSGRRSKLAAETLAELGYTNVKEFGGIVDWKYEIET